MDTITPDTDTIQQCRRNTHTSVTMLKWTTLNNKPTTAMSIFVDHEPAAPSAPVASTTLASRRSLGANLRPTTARPRDLTARKSLGSVVTSRKHQLRTQNKENQIMVSPHLAAASANMRPSPTTSTTPQQPKGESAFREIGNLTPQMAANGSATNTPMRKAYLPPSPSPTGAAMAVGQQQTPTRPPNHRVFAATLPTLNVEYSPACNVERPATICQRTPLSVHGITVQNSVFGTARYFSDAAIAHQMQQQQPKRQRLMTPPEMTPLAMQMAKLRFSQVSLQRAEDDEDEDEQNMSSKSLDDTALDRMIDEILESTRKCVRKGPKKPKQQQLPVPPQCQAVTTSGLAAGVRRPTDAAVERTLITLNGQQEREVRTPDSTWTGDFERMETSDSAAEPGLLRRQRVVRRKQTARKPKKSCEKATDILVSLQTPQAMAPAATITPPAGDEHQQQPEQDSEHASTRRCLRYPDSPDSLEGDCSSERCDKRQSVASSTASTASSARSSTRSFGKPSATVVFGTLDVQVALAAGTDQVHVHVLQCKDLSRSNGGPVNAYVKVALLSAAQSSDAGFQRTAVQRNSAEPTFEHRFVFDLQSGGQEATTSTERVQLSVWHRDREYKRSEFLGCLSFPVSSLVGQPIAGTYRLQSQSNLTHPTVSQLVQLQQEFPGFTASSTPANQSLASISLSKKAVYQREADEHLFLRNLQLSAADSINPTASGRTVCTLSKRLQSTGSKGFGFSVVWTHPPRVEKVEPGMSADVAGVRPGDFLAFVGDHNVVTMPEVDVLNLIRAQGAQLNIEVYRKQAKRSGMEVGLEEEEDDGQQMRAKVPRVEFCQNVGSGIIV